MVMLSNGSPQVICVVVVVVVWVGGGVLSRCAGKLLALHISHIIAIYPHLSPSKATSDSVNVVYGDIWGPGWGLTG